MSACHIRVITTVLAMTSSTDSPAPASMVTMETTAPSSVCAVGLFLSKPYFGLLC